MVGVPGDRAYSVPLAAAKLPDLDTLKATLEDAARRFLGEVQRLEQALARDTRQAGRLHQATQTRTRQRALLVAILGAVPAVSCPALDRAIRRRIGAAVRVAWATTRARRWSIRWRR